MGSAGIASRILSFGTGWRWTAIFTPRTFRPRGRSI